MKELKLEVIHKDVTRIMSLILLVINVIGMFVLGGLSIIVVLFRFKIIIIFNKLGYEIPHITSLLLSVQPKTYLLFFGVIIAVLIIKEFCIRAKSITLALNIFTAVGALAYLFVYEIALFTTFIMMIQMLWVQP